MNQTTFSEINITRQDNSYIINQVDEIDKLPHFEKQKEFTSKRAMAQYIGVNVRSAKFAPIQIIAPGNIQTTNDKYKALKNS